MAEVLAEAFDFTPLRPHLIKGDDADDDGDA